MKNRIFLVMVGLVILACLLGIGLAKGSIYLEKVAQKGKPPPEPPCCAELGDRLEMVERIVGLKTPHILVVPEPPEAKPKKKENVKP